MSYSNAVFYLDYVNGSDSARGTFAGVASNPAGSTTNIAAVGHGLITGAVVTLSAFSAWLNEAWKITKVDNDNFTLDGAVWQATADPNGTVAPFGGQNWADAWKTITSGPTVARIAPGDIVRIAKSSAPVSIGNGTWTDNTQAAGGFPATVAITSSTNATPIVITKVAHGYVNGDIIQVVGHTTNTAANGIWKVANKTADTLELEGSIGNGVGGATGTMQLVTSKVVQLATAQTKTITRCESNWTAIAGGDATPTLVAVSTDAKEGGNSVRITLDASVQVSKGQAYFALSGATDFSSYQNISFWLKNSAAINNATTWKVVLCSDAAGATPVDTFYIPAITTTGRWIPLNIAKSGGGNLGNSIQSIAVYSDTTAPANNSNILIDNFVACTTDGLNMQSLISSNSAEQGGTEGWHGIQSISENGTLIALDNEVNCKANAGNGYSGTTQTVTTYKRETIKTALVSAGSAAQTVQDDGSIAGGNIQFQGGYNTSNSVQDGETFFDGLNGLGQGIQFSGRQYITINYLNTYRYDRGIVVGSRCTITNISNSCNNTTDGVTFGLSGTGNSTYNTVTTISNANNNGNVGIRFGSTVTAESCYNTIKTINNSNNNSYGFVFGIGIKDVIWNIVKCNNNTNYGISFFDTNDTKIYAFSSKANTLAAIQSNYLTYNCIKNAVINESTPVSISLGDIYMTNYAAGANHRIYTLGAQIDSAVTDRVGGTGLMWKMAISSSTPTLTSPITLPVARIAVNANKAVTITAYMKKDHASDVGGSIVVKGGQLSGISSDVIATKANDTSWELLTLADFTPTEKGVIEIEAWGYYITGNSNVYVGEISVTQAS